MVPDEKFDDVGHMFEKIKHTVVSDEPEQEKPPALKEVNEGEEDEDE